jgi:hypothetical protein
MNTKKEKIKAGFFKQSPMSEQEKKRREWEKSDREARDSQKRWEKELEKGDKEARRFVELKKRLGR